jgi:hypothetical protein
MLKKINVEITFKKNSPIYKYLTSLHTRLKPKLYEIYMNCRNMKKNYSYYS